MMARYIKNIWFVFKFMVITLLCTYIVLKLVDILLGLFSGDLLLTMGAFCGILILIVAGVMTYVQNR